MIGIWVKSQAEINDKKFLSELLTLKEQVRFQERFALPEGLRDVVIAGMGGSGIVGGIFKELYSKLPVVLANSYELPDFVEKGTLVVAISYSGNTEETLAACAEAKKRGASIVGITSGGALAQEAEKVVKVPSGIQPRSALGYMLMPLLNSFEACKGGSIEETYGILERMDNDNSFGQKMAEEIFQGKYIPLVYGTSPYSSIAYRWSTQFNENSKVMALWSNFPELNHNNTMALEAGYRLDELYPICLLSNKSERIMRRINATQEVTGMRFRQIIEPQGTSSLAQVMSLMHIGDYLTYHLAKLRGVDPLDVSAIESLKAKLK